MVNPLVAVAAGTTALGGVMSYKGKRAEAKQVQQIAEYNAKVAENERVALAEVKAREEVRLRAQSERLVGTQRQLAASSGVQMTGSPALALADTFFSTEADALNIQQASSREQAAKTQEAAMIRRTRKGIWLKISSLCFSFKYSFKDSNTFRLG